MLGSLIGHHTSFLAFGMKVFQILPTWQLLGENIISPDYVIYPEFWMILEIWKIYLLLYKISNNMCHNFQNRTQNMILGGG